MKLTACIFLIAAAFAPCVSAQDAPSEVTDGEIARYKKGAQDACRQGGLAKGDPEARVDEFCSCAVATLDKSMKRTEWQQAYFYSLKKQETEERGVLAPHLKNVGACRPKA